MEEKTPYLGQPQKFNEEEEEKEKEKEELQTQPHMGVTRKFLCSGHWLGLHPIGLDGTDVKVVDVAFDVDPEPHGRQTAKTIWERMQSFMGLSNHIGRVEDADMNDVGLSDSRRRDSMLRQQENGDASASWSR